MKSVNIYQLVLFLILTLLIFFKSTATFSEEIGSLVPDIEVFIREGCPHCTKAELFLQKLKLEQPQLNIVIYDVSKEKEALNRLENLANTLKVNAVKVPAFHIGNTLLVGYSDEITTGQLIYDALKKNGLTINQHTEFGSCEAKQQDSLSCEENKFSQESFSITFLGSQLNLDDIGLPLFTIAMGLLDGFNPCSMWVLILMVSLLAPIGNRKRMFVIAGTFILVEGIAYFIFMTAWLNAFLFIGLSRPSEIIIASIAFIAGLIHLKDFIRYGYGFSLSIPKSAKPALYSRMRQVLQTQSLIQAIMGVIILAILVQIVEFLCTSGFPALFTRILTLKQLPLIQYYSYLILYNLAYLFDDMVVLTIGVITLSQKRLQEKEGRYLKLISGTVMVGLAVYLLVH